jgi:alpha-tubulin suppressor-like RCC1 family protein
MAARTRTTGAAVLRRAAAAALISLAAGLGPLAPTPQAALASTPGASSVSTGSLHTCAIESGKAYCWGRNDDGELGDGSTAGSIVPVAVDTSGALAGKTLTQISTADGDTCALDSAGAAYCWGNDDAGQLGDGGNSADHSTVPVAVETSGALAGKTLTHISTGDFDTCALDSAGAAYCWGYNGEGELGDGSTTDSRVPVAVDTSGALADKTLTQISAGGGVACVLDSASAAYCWGIGGGVLGNGSTTDSSVPVAVDTSGALADKTLTQISAGADNACALDSGGAGYCWGYNDLGSLGDGSTSDSTVPVAVDTSGVLAGQTLTQVSAGDYDVCAVDSGGAPYCWGENTGGELGDGSTVSSDVPVLAGPQAPTDVTAVPGDTAATVSWTRPASLDGGTLTGYTATAAPGTAACTTTGATTCTLTGLTDGITYAITVEANTTAGDSGASTPATVTPGHATSPPAFTSPAAVTAAYGARLAFTITAAGTPPPRITHTGPLPPGLRFAEHNGGTAAISGTPGRTAAGLYHLTLTATSTDGTATQAFTLTITRPPALATTRPAVTATTGKAFRLAIHVAGYPAPALAETGPLPAGLAFTRTSQDAVIAGTPAAGTAGRYPVTITATSTAGKAAAHITVTITQHTP